jgi:predicted transcriptional regulator
MICFNLYDIDEYMERLNISQNELARKVGIDPRNMTARKDAGNVVAELCGGNTVLMPKRVADELKRKSGYAG